MTPDRKAKLLTPDSTLKDVVRALCFRPQGIVFLVDDKKRLKAVMTDGDVRRALLAGASLEDSAFHYGVKRFVHGTVECAGPPKP